MNIYRELRMICQFWQIKFVSNYLRDNGLYSLFNCCYSYKMHNAVLFFTLPKATHQPTYYWASAKQVQASSNIITLLHVFFLYIPR